MQYIRYAKSAIFVAYRLFPEQSVMGDGLVSSSFSSSNTNVLMYQPKLPVAASTTAKVISTTLILLSLSR